MSIKRRRTIYFGRNDARFYASDDGWAGRSPHRHALLGPHLNIEMLVKGRDPVSKLLANRFVTEHCKLYPIDRSKTLMDRRVHQHILAREHNGKVSM